MKHKQTLLKQKLITQFDKIYEKESITMNVQSYLYIRTTAILYHVLLFQLINSIKQCPNE